MRRRAWIPILLATLVAAVSLAAAQQNQRQTNDDRPLTLEEIRALVARAIADQHADDREADVYDRTEHTVQKEGGKDAASTDTVDHVIPTGTGEARVTIDRNGKPVDAMAIEEQWREIAKELTARKNPNDPAVRDEFEREEHRERAHAEMIDAIGKAFCFSYQGRTTLDGRTIVELSFVPDPSYKSSTRYAMVFAHLVGTLWVDEPSGQVVRLEARLRDDVPFGGGIIAKLYRGSWLKVSLSEVAPGIWLPANATYDIEGRKFVFSTGWRGQIEASNYRRVGPPSEALAVLQREHGEAIASER